MIKKIGTMLIGILILVGVAGCQQPADVVSVNVSKAADNFQILRRVVFYNGITNEYMLSIEGYCALGNNDDPDELTVMCKVGMGDNYKKHFLGLSDNVTYFVEQLDGASVSPNHYKVIFRPSTIIPDVEIK